MNYYRLVDIKHEPANIIINSDTENASPRMLQSIRLSDLFELLLQFWANSGVQLDTASDSMIHFPDYISDIQDLEAKGQTIVPTSLINPNEKMQTIPLNVLKTIIFPYYEYFKNGISLNTEDLPYIWEYLWEIVRKSFFNDKTSRFRSVFLFDEYNLVKNFQEDTLFFDKTICSVDIIETFDIQKYDMNWLTMVPVNCTFNEMCKYATNYWAGNLTEKPIMEYLFSGKYKLHCI